MLRTLLIVGAAVSALSVAACGNKTADNNTAATTPDNTAMSNAMSNAAGTATNDTTASTPSNAPATNAP